MNDNSNDDINIMAKYFVNSSQIQNQSNNQIEKDNSNFSNLIKKELMNNNNMNLNMNTYDSNNAKSNLISSQMNSSFESTMTNPVNLNNEIMGDLMGGDYQDKKLTKLIRSFKKKIKLRNATIKKNFWKQEYITSKLINVKISSLFPMIEPTQGFCLCIYNYMNNKQFKELICKVENETITNKLNGNLVEKYTVINQEENQLNNLLINPISYMDNNKHRKEMIKLISSIYYRVKSLKFELGKSKENYVFNYLVVKSKKMNNNQPYIYGKLYSIFPNINFHLHEINKLSLSSRFKLNKLLISKHHTNIQNEKGEKLTNGFITMSNEKRIITLTDDTNKKELQESQSLKQIIFGIWLSLKDEDVSNYGDVEELVNKHRHFIYRKCLEFVLASQKIETIFSPSPDEGIFLLILFFKTSQSYFEVKIIPNEEDKCFKDNCQENQILENFSNEWLIRTQKFDFINNNGQFLFNFQPYLNRNKVCTVNDFICEHLNNKKSEKNIDNYNNIIDNNKINFNNMNTSNMKSDINNFNNSQKNLNNNYYNNSIGYNMNNNDNNQMNKNMININQNNNMIMNNNINNLNNIQYLNNELNNQYNNINSKYNPNLSNGFNISKGYQESNYNKEISHRNYRISNAQTKAEIIPNDENKNINNKEIFDPLADIFEHNNNEINNNSNPSSNNNIPYIKKNSCQQSQSLYSTNNNPKTSYNPNEYLKMGQMNINQQQIYNQEFEDNHNNNINENENIKNQIYENNKILNNIGSVYGDINDENLLSSNLGGLSLPVNNQGMNNKMMNIQNNNNQNQKMYGQIMMNNINNNNSNRDEISQQSNTNCSQYTLGKKVYSCNHSQNDSNTGNNNQNININNSNQNLNQLNINNNNYENNNAYMQMTPSMNSYNKYSQEMVREANTFNISRKNTTSNENINYSKTNPNMYNFTSTSNQYETMHNHGEIPIQKEDKSTQTIYDEKTNLYNDSQKQSLNIIIREQTENMQKLQNKVNHLEELLAKVNLLLKRKNDNEKNNDSDISNDNDNENENDESFNNKSKSESLKNSGNNSKENIIINKDNTSNLYMSNNNTNNNYNDANNIKGNINSNINKINKNDISNDDLYRIKNVSNFLDSNNKFFVMNNKNILSNEESEDNDLSSDLNVSDSKNCKDNNKSINVGDKTIEIPKIKFNSALLNSNNDDTENNISSN